MTPAIPLFLVLPFALLLGMIATGPVLYPHFWHRAYGWVAVGLGALVVAYYVGVLGEWHHPLEALAEYVQFIALIGALYMASGGIWIRFGFAGSPAANVALLWCGGLLANVIGTTGASMLLIRPFMRLNAGRLRAYHVVFFIFMVSNVGGALTPIGDPPLFLGFLKGVPFFWTLRQGWVAWAVALGLLARLVPVATGVDGPPVDAEAAPC